MHLKEYRYENNVVILSLAKAIEINCCLLENIADHCDNKCQLCIRFTEAVVKKKWYTKTSAMTDNLKICPYGPELIWHLANK